MKEADSLNSRPGPITMEAALHLLRPQFVPVTGFKLISILSFNSHDQHMGPGNNNSAWQLEKAIFKDLSIGKSYLSSKRQNSNSNPGVHRLTSPLQLSGHPCSFPGQRGSKARGPGLSCRVSCWPCGCQSQTSFFPIPSPCSVAFLESVCVPPPVLGWWHGP